MFLTPSLHRLVAAGDLDCHSQAVGFDLHHIVQAISGHSFSKSANALDRGSLGRSHDLARIF